MLFLLGKCNRQSGYGRGVIELRIKLDNNTPVVKDNASIHIGKSVASVIDDNDGDKTTITSFEDMLNKKTDEVVAGSTHDKIVQASELSVKELTKLYLELGITSAAGKPATTETSYTNVNTEINNTEINNTEVNYTESANNDTSVNSKKLPFVVPDKYKPIFEKAAKKYNIDYNVLVSVASAESDFNPNCTSRSGAMGIMQLMPETAKYLGVKDAYDPEQNIMGGARYLAEKFNQHGCVKLGLAGYNAGSNAVKKYNGVPPYTETQNYVKKILGYLGTDGSESGFVSYKDSDYTDDFVYETSEDESKEADNKMPDDIPTDTVIQVGDKSMGYSAYLKYIELLQ